MPERVKLEEPGAELILRVSKVTKETVQNSDYYLFTNGGKELLVPVSSVSRQLANMEISDVTTLVGKVIKLSRSQKLSRYGKPFWDLLLATPEESAKAGVASAAVPGAPSNGAVAAGATSGPHKSFQDIYASATKFVIDQIVPKYTAAKFEVTASDVRGMVADLFTAKLKES